MFKISVPTDLLDSASKRKLMLLFLIKKICIYVWIYENSVKEERACFLENRSDIVHNNEINKNIDK